MQKRVALAVTMFSVVTAHAALVSRGNGMIFDSAQNITWLADWNYSQTSGFDADGLMNWTTANNWANNLTHGGFTGWRLPSALNRDGTGPCFGGPNCNSSELGYLYFTELGNRGSQEPFTAGPFQMLRSEYWLGTEFNSQNAWTFQTYFGQQSLNSKNTQLYAVAVRSGDVAPAVVPIPAAAWLMFSGIAALGTIMRWRRAA